MRLGGGGGGEGSGGVRRKEEEEEKEKAFFSSFFAKPRKRQCSLGINEMVTMETTSTTELL